MSREHIETNGYYFHEALENGACELLRESIAEQEPLWGLVGELLLAIQPIVSEIAGEAASDCTPPAAIQVTIQQMEAIKRAVIRLEAYQKPFADVAKDAALVAIADLRRAQAVGKEIKDEF